MQEKCSFPGPDLHMILEMLRLARDLRFRNPSWPLEYLAQWLASYWHCLVADAYTFLEQLQRFVYG